MQSGSTPQTPDYYSDLQLPSVNDMQLQLQQLVEQGVLSPEEAQAEMLGRSEMDNITLDPSLKKAQMDALSGLQEITAGGGMTSMDKANLSRIANEEAASSKGARDSIIQNAQSRGLGGSGLELMSQMQNEQGSAMRKSQRDLDVAGMAQQRALEALMQSGELGGKMAAQEFGQQAQVADANDAISKFNAQNKQAVGMANTQARNAAQEANLNRKQGVADQNVALKNEQQMHNKALIQQNYENELKKRGGRAGIAQANAQAAGQDSQNRANANNQMIGGLMSAGASMYGARGK